MHAGRHFFEFNMETKSALLEAFNQYPELLRDLDHAVAECEARAARMEVMEQRKIAFIQQNNTLRSHSEAAQSLSRPTTGQGRLSCSGRLSTLCRSSMAKWIADEFDECVPSTGGTVKEDWRQVPYLYDGPGTRGEVRSLLPEGRLFRIFKANQLYFYNDSCYYRMHVSYGFPKSSRVALGVSSQWTKRLSCELGEATMILDPLETKLLCTGNIANATDRCRAEMMTRDIEKQSKFKGEMNDAIQTALNEVMKNCPSWMREPEKHPKKRSSISEKGVEECLKSLLPFVDILFPPTRKSLHRDDADRFYIPPLVWKRPKEYLPSGADIRLFRETLQIQESGRDGRFPNRHFSSILRFLISSNASCVKDLFRHPESALRGKLERLLGISRVSLCVGGWWRSVVVDTYVPATCSQPLFTHDPSDLRNTWIVMLEKSLAKTFGSYAALMECSSIQYFSMMTGSPCCSLSSMWPSKKSYVKLSEFMRSLRTQRRMKVLLETYSTSETCKRRGLPALYEKLGLGAGQTVACTGVEVIGGATLLHLQPNRDVKPNEWLGAWGTEGKRWTTEVAELIVGLDAKNTVWMDIADLPRFFLSGYSAFDINNMDEIRVKGSFSGAGKPTLAVKVTVNTHTPLLISLVQPNRIRAIGFSVYAESRSPVKSSFVGATTPTPAMQVLVSEGQQSVTEEVFGHSTFSPDAGSYYIIPEAAAVDRSITAWTLGLFAEAGLLCSSADISFVTIHENYSYFSGDAGPSAFESVRPCDGEFQVRLPGQRTDYQRKKQVF